MKQPSEKIPVDRLQEELKEKHRVKVDNGSLNQKRAAIQNVVDYANKLHRGMLRKGTGLPYIVHPMEVLTMLAEWGVLLDAVIEHDESDDNYNKRIDRNFVVWKAAICHDVREDCGVSFESLVKVIGAEAANIVEELTFTPDRSSSVLVSVQKQGYINSFDEKSNEALLIKCADRISNTRSFFADDKSADYAAKYWKKGSSLFDVVKKRSETLSLQIDFGLTVVARLKYSRDTTNRLVVR